MKKNVITKADIRSAEGEVSVLYHRVRKLLASRSGFVDQAMKSAGKQWDSKNGATLQSTLAAMKSAEERLRKLQVAKSEQVNRLLIGTQVVEWARVMWSSPSVYKPTGRRGIVEVSDGMPANGRKRCQHSPGQLVVRLFRQDSSVSKVVVPMGESWLKEGVQHNRAINRLAPTTGGVR